MSYIKLYEEFLNEGGKVFKDTRSLHGREIPKTKAAVLAEILPALGLDPESESDSAVVGSAAFDVGSVNDIDITVSKDAILSKYPKQAEEDVAKFVHDKLSFEMPDSHPKLLKGLNVVCLDYPIKGTDDGGHAQVDVIPVVNMEWARFVYKHNPKSEYKGAHRNWLLCAIFAAKKFDKVRSEDGKLLAYKQNVFKLADGVFKTGKSFEGVSGNLLKNAQKTDEVFVTAVPSRAIKMLFGERLKQHDVDTFEKCWDIVGKWDNVDRIRKHLIEFLTRAKLEVPEEVHAERNQTDAEHKNKNEEHESK